MSEKSKNRRILLRPEMAAKVSELTQKLRQKHCSVNASKISNAIIELFFEKYLAKEESSLEQLFFNKRHFLKQALAKAETDGDLEEVLQNALKKVNNKKKREKKGLASVENF